MKSLLIAAVAIAGLGMASCAKCTVCTKSNETDVRICEKDYDSKTEYGFAIDVYEAQDYDCGKSI